MACSICILKHFEHKSSLIEVNQEDFDMSLNELDKFIENYKNHLD